MHGGKESTLNQQNYAQPYRQLKSSLFTSAWYFIIMEITSLALLWVVSQKQS